MSVVSLGLGGTTEVRRINEVTGAAGAFAVEEHRDTCLRA
jgi:hypothetical protein